MNALTEVDAYKIVIKDLLILLHHLSKESDCECYCEVCETIRATYSITAIDALHTFKYQACLPKPL